MTVKAVPFEPSKLTREDRERKSWGGHVTRYCIVDAETGEVLDDAQGYGYKTGQKAHAAWSFKNRPPAKQKAMDEERTAVWSWLRQHPGFLDTLEDAAFVALKEGDAFDADQVGNLLSVANLCCPVSPAALLRYWKAGEPVRRRRNRNRKNRR